MLNKRFGLWASCSILLGLSFTLASCGGSDDSVALYADDPPERVSPALTDEAIPETLDLVPLRPAVQVLAQTSAGSGLDPVSKVDPATVLGGGKVDNRKVPGNKNLKLIADMLDANGVPKKPVPTGKWYKGFFYESPRNQSANFDGGALDAIEQNVFAFPYRLWLDDRIGMVTVGFPRRRFLDPGNVAALGNFSNPYRADDYLFNVQPDQRADAFLTYLPPATGKLARRIDHEDELLVSTSWNGGSGATAQSMQLIAAVGSPYVTVKYQNLQPQIGMGESISAQIRKNNLNQVVDNPPVRDVSKWEVNTNIKAVSADAGPVQAFQEAGAVKTPELTGKKFRFVYASPDQSFPNIAAAQRVMVVYASQPLTLAWDAPSRTYAAKAPFTGTIRVAFVDDQMESNAPAATAVSYAAEAILDAHANEYPVATALNLTYAGAATATVKYTWRTESLSGTSDSSKLMMMAFDATHLKSMSGASTADLHYRSNFGRMTAVMGNTWTQTLEIPAILRESSNKELLWRGSKPMKEADKPAILASLKADLLTIKGDKAKGIDPWGVAHCNYESYLCGKAVGLTARMVLIADELDDGKPADGLRNELLDLLKQQLTPWFDAKDDGDPDYANKLNQRIADFFMYDTFNRGVVTKRPFAFDDISQDFYNAVYTDHMFHYGYFIYAAAVLGRYDAAWREKYKEPVNTLVRDIANASLDDTFFPITRTYDWFRMQNVADSGPDANGANTESSSEAINAGYGLVLWGAATGQGDLQGLASVMLAGEIRHAQAFYQVTPSTNVFTEVAAKTVSVTGPDGKSSSLTLDPATLVTWGIKRMNITESQVFFGPRRVFRIGIQILPITPISEYVFSPAWLQTHSAALLQLEQDETRLYEDLFTISPMQNKCALDPNGAITKIPAADCAGSARVLYSWRQLIASVNGVNDPSGTYQRYTGYMGKVAAQTAAFAKLSAGTPFDYIDSNTNQQVTGKYGPDGVNADILKDMSTPSNNTNVLWWLSARKP